MKCDVLFVLSVGECNAHLNNFETHDAWTIPSSLACFVVDGQIWMWFSIFNASLQFDAKLTTHHSIITNTGMAGALSNMKGSGKFNYTYTPTSSTTPHTHNTNTSTNNSTTPHAHTPHTNTTNANTTYTNTTPTDSGIPRSPRAVQALNSTTKKLTYTSTSGNGGSSGGASSGGVSGAVSPRGTPRTTIIASTGMFECVRV